MNTTARLDFLLGSKVNNSSPAPSKAANPSVSVSAFKGQLEKQLYYAKSTDNLIKNSQTDINKAKSETEVAGGQVQALDKNRQSASGDLTEYKSGESLPISEDARKFLAGLPEEDQQQVLEEVREWFASLSPEALQNLKQQLEEDPQQLIASMPPELQALLANLQKMDLDDLEVLDGFSALLAGLLSADIDFQRIAAIQFQPGAVGELRLFADTASQRSNETLSVITRGSAAKDNLSLITKEDKTNTKEQANELSLSKQDKLSELISNLGKASAQGVARTGGEALSQLLQAAGMGLTGSQAAGAGTQTVGRMAAGFTSMPLMMQAAAESNAQALASRISMMNAKNLQVAEMRLDPPNLGSIRIQIRMQGEQASVIFQAPNPHARELLEQSLPKLREMMESEGLMLADAQVSEESFSGQGQEQDGSGQYAGSGLAGGGELADEMQIPLLTQPLGLIDYYA